MTKEKRKKTMLAVALVLILLAIAYLVYTSFLSKPELDASLDIVPAEEDSEVPGGPEIEPGIPVEISSPKLKTDLLTDPRFTDLVIFGDLPVEVGEVGRENPFIPFEGYGTGGGEEEEEGEGESEEEGEGEEEEEEGAEPPEMTDQ